MLRKQAARFVTGSICCLVILLSVCLQAKGGQAEDREALHRKILAGEQVILNRDAPPAPRGIDAAWIKEAALKHVPIRIDGAIIRGRVGLRYVVFDEEVDFERCVFEDDVDFSYTFFKQKLIFNDIIFMHSILFYSATFNYETSFSFAEFRGGAVFDGSHALNSFGIGQSKFFAGAVAAFHYAQFARIFDLSHVVFECDAHFYGARFGYRTGLGNVTFKKVADFESAQFAGDVSFPGVVFEGKATFQNAHIFGNARFAREVLPASTFRDESNFAWSEIDGIANYDGVVFEKKVSFVGIKVGRVAGFSQAHFQGGADFSLAQVGGSAFFCGSLFKEKTTFDRAQITGSAAFGSSSKQGTGPATFDGDVDFTSVHFGNGASFDGVQFNNSQTSFRDAMFQGETSSQGANFEGNADFRGVQFESEARFGSSTFGKSADFADTRFAASVYFNSGSLGQPASGGAVGTYFQEVLFDHAQFFGDARFDDTRFGGPVSFREAKFRMVYFSPDGRVRTAQGQEDQFRSTPDLRGATYERIDVAWRDIFRESAAYDRQPYTELEKALRSVGRDDEADEVWLERHQAERRQVKWSHSKTSWFVDWFILGLLLNYGVLSWKLFCVPLCIMLGCALIFFRPNAVIRPDDRFTFLDSLRLSIRTFLPLNTPLGSRWEFSNDRFFSVLRYSDVAAVLKLVGWIYVPVWVVIVTGFIRYVAR